MLPSCSLVKLILLVISEMCKAPKARQWKCRSCSFSKFGRHRRQHRVKLWQSCKQSRWPAIYQLCCSSVPRWTVPRHGSAARYRHQCSSKDARTRLRSRRAECISIYAQRRVTQYVCASSEACSGPISAHQWEPADFQIPQLSIPELVRSVMLSDVPLGYIWPIREIISMVADCTL